MTGLLSIAHLLYADESYIVYDDANAGDCTFIVGCCPMKRALISLQRLKYVLDGDPQTVRDLVGVLHTLRKLS